MKLPKPAGSGKILRRAVFAAISLVLAAFSLAPARADVLVSNIGQTGTATVAVGSGSGFVMAQCFTTGTENAGYTLESVELYFADGNPSNYTPRVSIYDANAMGIPGSSQVVLENPTISQNSSNTFDAPTGTTLAKETTYCVVVEDTSSGALGFSLAATGFNEEDSDSLSQWSIADHRMYKSTSNTSWTSSAAHKVRIAVNGTANAQTNTAPTAENSDVTTDEDTDYTFAASDFNFSDTDSGDTLASVKITTLPASGKGTLELDSTAITASDLPQTVTKAELDDDKLVYSPPANANGDNYAGFSFRVNDGTVDSASAYTMTIDVTAVNDAATGRPTITGRAQVGQTLTVTRGDMADVDGLPTTGFPTGYSLQWYRVDMDNGEVESEISGATSTTYVLVAADEGNKVRVRVSFTDGGGELESLESWRFPRSRVAAAAPAEVTVMNSWALVPSGLSTGDRFRLIFATSTERDATSSYIDDYSSFVQSAAAAGHAAIRAYSDGFRAVGSTRDIDARDYTGTTGTGVPIYWLDGHKVADNYGDFYDGTWDNETNPTDEDGNSRDLAGSNAPYTGSNSNGTKRVSGSTYFTLGETPIIIGALAAPGGPLFAAATANADNRPFYALSQVFRVVTDTTAPVVRSAQVDGASLVITFNQRLAAAANLANSAFTVKKTPSGGTEETVALSSTAPVISGRTVTLTLATPVATSDTGIKVSYTKPTTGTDNKLKDANGNEADSFTDRAVTNNTADTTAPTVTSIVRQDPSTSPTNSDTLKWRVTFSEDVQNVDAADFGVSNTTAGLAVAAVTGSESQYDVTAGGGNLAGLNSEVTLSIKSGHNITDKAATPNALTNTTPTGTNESSYVVDNDRPSVSSATINGATLVITFGEDLDTTSSLPNSAFTVEKSVGGTDTEQTLTGTPSISGRTVTLTLETAVSHIDTGIIVSYRRPSSPSNRIRDVVGNSAGSFTDQIVSNNTADTIAPRVNLIQRQTPSVRTTNADSVTWRVTFDENVQNVDQADFEVSGTSATLAVTAVSGSERIYDVTASGGDLANYDGTVTLSFASGQNITDKAATPNALTNTTPIDTNDNTYVIDNTGPTVTSATINGASLVITFNEGLRTLATLRNTDFTVKKDVGGTATEQTLTGTPSIGTGIGFKTLTLTLMNVVTATDTDITVSYARPSSASNRIQDLLGNPAANFTDRDVTNNTTDTTAPTVTSIVRQDPETSPTNSDTLKWRVDVQRGRAERGRGGLRGVQHHGHPDGGGGHRLREPVRRDGERRQPVGPQFTR